MQEKVSMQPFAVRNGLFLGLVSSVFTLVTYITGLYLNPSASWISFPVSLALTIFFMVQAFNAFKKENGGYMSLGEGFKGGFILTLISTFISGVVNYIYMAIVDPSIITSIVAAQRETMMQNPELTEEQIDQAMSITSGFMTPEFIAISAIVMGIIGGAIISLIVAAVAKKDYETY